MNNEYRSINFLIAEIEAMEYYKDNPHLIDKPAIYRWTKNALRGFGLNIMQKKDFIVDVKNYKGVLPKDFAFLSLALFCEKDGCYVDGNEDRLLSTKSYSEKIEETYMIAAEDCDKKIGDTYTTITENIKVDDTQATIFYSNPSDRDWETII